MNLSDVRTRQASSYPEHVLHHTFHQTHAGFTLSYLGEGDYKLSQKTGRDTGPFYMVAETRICEFSTLDLVPILDPSALCLLPPYVLWKPCKPGFFVALPLQCHSFSLDSSVQPIHEDTVPGLGAAIMADICD